MIIAASVMLGRYAALHQKDEVRTLEMLVKMFSDIKSMLGFTCPPVGDILIKLCSDPGFSNLAFLNECKIRCEQGEVFPDAWENALKGKYRESSLSHENAQKLSGFGRGLGATDLEGQLASCALYESMFSAELERIEKTVEKNSKLYVPLGFFAGLAAAIFIV